MANLVDELRRGNNRQDKLLTKENGLIMADMVIYLRSSQLCDYDIELIRRDLFGMIYEAQLRNEPAAQAVGEDYKSFCEELMKSGRQKDSYEKFLERTYIGVVGVGVLFIIEFLSSELFPEVFHSGNISMSISYGFLVSTCLIIAGALVVYWFITKHTFELSRKGLSSYKVYFVAGFAFYFAGTILIKVILGGRNLFEVNALIPLGILSATFLIVKILGDRNANRIAATHR